MITLTRRAVQESRAMSPWDRKGKNDEQETKEKQMETRRKAAPLICVLFF